MFIHATAGTDTYGKVKTVLRTPVVTEFTMLQFLPLYPVRSYYFFSTAKAKTGGVPFFLSTHTAKVHGIPLVRVDKASVVMAYLRAVFALLLVGGFLWFIVGIDIYQGKPVDRVQWIIFEVMLSMFIVGTVGGTLTYVVPVLSQREKHIRLFCGELLGIGVDPAMVLPEQAQRMEKRAGSVALRGGRTNPLLTRNDCLHELISVRSWIAQGQDAGHLEARTDELLERLNHSWAVPTYGKHVF